MKKPFGKRLGALICALALVFGLIPVSANAATMCPTGQHTPGTTLYPANWNNVTGGYVYDYYICTVCGWGVDANGMEHQFVGPCNQGHTPGTDKHDANYTPCNGGFTVDFYECIGCGCPVDADGNELQYTAGTGVHTPGAEKHDADYAPCSGGFKADFYECTGCGCIVDANGTELQYTEGTGVHTPGAEKHDANYAPCRGGFKVDFYECTGCGCPVDADGNELKYTEGSGVHTPGAEKHDADYAPCSGGFTVDFYECTGCGWPVDADGNELQYTEGSGVHDLDEVPGQAPTYDEYGYTSFWACKDCGAAFRDAAGTIPIEDIEEILLPKLEPDEAQRVEISAGLPGVPQSVADQHSSVKSIYKALVNAAVASDEAFNEADVKSVLLDVTLQVQNADGTWTDVTPEDFPAEGVEVILPYPEGTNADDFIFVVTHMITSGSRAGEIEVLPCTLEQDGICVRFTSMSPVVIAYQAKKAGNAAETSSTGNPTAENTAKDSEKVVSVQTGDTSNVVLWSVILLCSGCSLFFCLTRKKKTR